MVQSTERIWDQRFENLEKIKKFQEDYDFPNALRICEIPDVLDLYTIHLYIQKVILLADFGYFSQAKDFAKMIMESDRRYQLSEIYLRILIDQRDLAEAYRFLQELHSDFDLYLGMVKYHESDYKQAIKFLERGISKLDTSQKPPQQAILAYSYAKTGNPKKSSQLFEKINAQIKKNNESMWIQSTMTCFFFYALIEMEYGSREKTIDTFKLILNTTKFLDFRLISDCAKICKQMNESELTAKFIERLKRINPTHEEVRLLETP